MSEPSSTEAQAINTPSATLSSTLSPIQIEKEPRIYRRYAVEDGDRLANARNFDHSRAPPLPAVRNAVARSGGGVIPPGASAFASASERSLIFVQAATASQGVPVPAVIKYGSEKGSYRGPYEYANKPGFQPNGQNTSAKSSSSFASSPFSRAHAPPLAKAIPLRPSIARPATRVVVPPEDAEERWIFLSPLRIVYHHCSIPKPDDHDCGTHPASMHSDFLYFLDSRMGGELQKVIERDPFMPSVVYVVGIKMRDSDLEKYRVLLAEVPEALRMQKMLEEDPASFDEFTASSERTEIQVETYRFMARCRLEELDLEGASKQLVKHFGPMWKASGTWIG